MKNTTLTVLVVAACVAAFVAMSRLRQQEPAGSGVHVIAGVDGSNSVRHEGAGRGSLMGRSIATMARLAIRLDPDRDRVTVMRVDREAREFYDQKAPVSREKFQWLLIGKMKPRPAVEGTFPARFWSHAAQRAAAAQVPVAIAYYGDADNDDLSPAARTEIRAAARRLAGNPRVVSVTFFGANSRNWETLRTDFAPLGDRLHLHGESAMEVTPLLDELDAARLKGRGRQPGRP